MVSRRNLEEATQSIKSKYELRGRPAECTGWTPQQMRAWVVHHMAMVREGGKVPKQLGAFKWDLPRRSSDGRPPPLPKEVMRFLDTKRTAAETALNWQR